MSVFMARVDYHVRVMTIYNIQYDSNILGYVHLKVIYIYVHCTKGGIHFETFSKIKKSTEQKCAKD